MWIESASKTFVIYGFILARTLQSALTLFSPLLVSVSRETLDKIYNNYKLLSMIAKNLEKTRLWLERAHKLLSAFEPSQIQVNLLESYLDMLMLWSKKVDLVALASRQELIERHVVDSYAAYLLIKSKLDSKDMGRCLDVGSGAGLPGIIFAILEPGSEFYLCEPREKRQIFLKEAIQSLGLGNVRILGSRLEEVIGEYDLISSRALGMEDVFEKYARPLLSEKGLICQLLGPSWERGARSEPLSVLNYSLFESGPERKLVFWG